ncbi:diguanylate cyclase [Agarivorans sp. B2Z047]|uniref:DEAD/DEAH box helicase n=1 Tax=Agarivorans sp. B2Z047 TaxID=2652721 RepID=UPI00128D8779|nr:DEAD/DEAH box helicase family protein [Agarivorans sp. B2Z047]MPW31620.1 diguanylate cyclase [Agarivorans sp. B2Z047]UQN42420.1 DEAD/DEAH box helicase family protein [Agarivorans sp. B2Z047]
MKLRKWQIDCVQHALQLYNEQQHFMCLATPAAGKTLMAAELSRCLLKSNKIDFILCFSPSAEVSNSIRATFSKRLGNEFNGMMGSIGNALTYQSMASLSPSFWRLLSSHRVMVIMDEVHHLKGHEFATPNAWGEEVLTHIQNKAAYTLALSGTPWRSDKAPIVLSKFTEPDNTIHCDFVYGLHNAIEDGVCRTPRITLVDNDNIHLTEDIESHTFNSISALLDGSSFNYSALLHHPEVMLYLLSLGVNKLTETRALSPNAGGLVVATSIQHALRLYDMLVNDFGQSACLVNSQMKHPSSIIEHFRFNDTQWIVSVGMIAEGTDIPRLQVCCHLSRIKTEMHYRQVLGRVLRVDDSRNKVAWLFTLAEPSLIQFAYNVDTDLPDGGSVVFEQNTQSIDLSISSGSQHANNPQNYEDKPESFHVANEVILKLGPRELQSKHCCVEEEANYNLAMLGDFKQQIVRLFG